MTPRCVDCAYWSFDMDMDPFCVHPNANAWGTNIDVMRGVKQTSHMRGEPCGPEAKFFEKSNRRNGPPKS